MSGGVSQRRRGGGGASAIDLQRIDDLEAELLDNHVQQPLTFADLTAIDPLYTYSETPEASIINQYIAAQPADTFEAGQTLLYTSPSGERTIPFRIKQTPAGVLFVNPVDYTANAHNYQVPSATLQAMEASDAFVHGTEINHIEGNTETTYYVAAPSGALVQRDTVTITGGGTTTAASDYISQDFVATAGQAVFPLIVPVTDLDSFSFRHANAPELIQGVDYTLTAGTVTLNSAMAALVLAGDQLRASYL